ncbi:hypothetical protein SAMN00017477_0082 [Peptoniphilus asaccharolyticus DSM 20463]|uniref:Uncharacterized protein n=1 Tax=Peptoniphilus asaccharolyticus DSM 20463 TaxID=573058 RepID=A0A1W1UC54_PEPAS|nr:hypothetical protein [Peptoniphilus asaccharolyticus]MBL7576417.1 hypothetical protein [Peptoniphilus asaccharolyticus]SMB78678.1 hypothetical protein SAMN00017477_0082 [Peptoniphilus asaccharolyticus DSM 20463]
MKKEISGNRIKYFINLLNVSLKDFSNFSEISYPNLIRVVSRTDNLNIKTANIYLNKIEELSEKLSDGEQILFLSIDDLFF